MDTSQNVVDTTVETKEIELTIQNLKNEKYVINIDPSSTILDLKTIICVQQDTETDLIKLIFSGNILKEDTKTLSEYGLKNGNTLVSMIARKRKKKEQKKEQPTNTTNTPSTASTVIPSTASTANTVVPNTSVSTSVSNSTESTTVSNTSDISPNYGNNSMNSLLNSGNIGGLINALGNPQSMEQLMTTMQGDPSMMLSYISMQTYNMLTRSDVLNRLLRQHPIIGSYATSNPDEFKNIISDPNFLRTVAASGDVIQQMSGTSQQMSGMTQQSPTPSQPPQTIQLTDTEKNDVNNLVALGFQEDEVIRVYIACGKNTEQAANVLFSG